MRRRFVLVSLAVTALVAVAFAAPLAWAVRTVAYDRALSGAEREVASMSTVLAVTGDIDKIRRAAAKTDAGGADRLAVHLPGGRTVGRSAGWAPVTEIRQVAAESQHQTVPVPGGVAHLHPAGTVSARATTAGTAVIEIMIPNARLHHGVFIAWAVLASVSLLLLVGSALLTDRLAAGAVRATRELA
ncbi:MAG: two-component sensor histidine kinase, partial [Actinocatenispora sp.]